MFVPRKIRPLSVYAAAPTRNWEMGTRALGLICKVRNSHGMENGLNKELE